LAYPKTPAPSDDPRATCAAKGINVAAIASDVLAINRRRDVIWEKRELGRFGWIHPYRVRHGETDWIGLTTDTSKDSRVIKLRRRALRRKLRNIERQHGPELAATALILAKEDAIVAAFSAWVETAAAEDREAVLEEVSEALRVLRASA
jgi:hypothetical protein